MTLRIPRRKPKIDSMLSLYRRHVRACPHRPKGVRWIKCNCPVYVWGELNGKWIRKAVGTRNMSQARRTIESWELARTTDEPTSVESAAAAFLEQHKGNAEGTRVKYGTVMRFFGAFCKRQNYLLLDQLRVETFDAYRGTRDIGEVTWRNELQVLRGLCGFCHRREWMRRNVAGEVETPKNLKPRAVEPYSELEMVAIIQAADRIGNQPYERLRARAMVLLMRYTALGISDVYSLRRDKVRDGMIETRRTKTDKPILLPVLADLQAALDAVPWPHGADELCPYYFWSGKRSLRHAVGDCWRTMASVFRLSGVAGGRTHRFRHTLATRMLAKGATYEDVAAVLGNSPGVVEKHYAKWSRDRQARITRLFLEAHGAVEGSEVVQ
ncbi:hypothetical protein LCGC14_1535060 [marine sediment metagenome]|uniref:Tyr recombinase domain-containing protein n=1 Tax=marine sediment metagenome TaxID=412755 RepID=A0A0F9IUU5_9ZZZZ